MANYFSVSYKTADGEEKHLSIEATSGTHAISVAREQYEELYLHPNRIYRVVEESPS